MSKHSKIYKNLLMRRYLHSGSKGFKQHIAMMKWIHEKGLRNVYEFMQDIFGMKWNMSIDEAIKEVQNHDL